MKIVKKDSFPFLLLKRFEYVNSVKDDREIIFQGLFKNKIIYTYDYFSDFRSCCDDFEYVNLYMGSRGLFLKDVKEYK